MTHAEAKSFPLISLSKKFAVLPAILRFQTKKANQFKMKTLIISWNSDYDGICAKLRILSLCSCLTEFSLLNARSLSSFV